MRVALNAEQLLSRSPGGIGRYTAQLLTVLPELFPDCEMVGVTAMHPRSRVDELLADAGVRRAELGRLAVQALPRPALYEAWARFGRPALRGVDEVDVVHAPSLAIPPTAAPLVVTVHDAASEVHPEAFTARGRRFHRLGLETAARRADAVITVSAAAAEEILAHSSIPSERVRVVPNGVSPPPFSADEDAVAIERLGLAGGRYVLWVGTLEPRKGCATLVSAMATIRRRRRHAGVQTVMAGYKGWLGARLIRREDQEALGDTLRQVGAVSESELWALYRGAAVFAFPSRHEGFGLPVLEAMSQGVPVVASDIPALREVTAGAAVLVPPDQPAAWADSIEALLDGGDAARAVAAAGLERSARFSAAAMARATRSVYQEISS